MIDMVQVVAGAAIPVMSQYKGLDSVFGSATGTVSIPQTLPAKDSVDVRVHATTSSIVKAFDGISAEAAGSKNVASAVQCSGHMDGKCYASKNILAEISEKMPLKTIAAGSVNILSTCTISDALMALTEAVVQITETVTMKITIPPGGELRIDSETYTATLNGENVLHLQDGDWIRISRDLQRLNVESATGGPLEGQILYTARWL